MTDLSEALGIEAMTLIARADRGATGPQLLGGEEAVEIHVLPVEGKVVLQARRENQECIEVYYRGKRLDLICPKSASSASEIVNALVRTVLPQARDLDEIDEEMVREQRDVDRGKETELWGFQ